MCGETNPLDGRQIVDWTPHNVRRTTLLTIALLSAAMVACPGCGGEPKLNSTDSTAQRPAATSQTARLNSRQDGDSSPQHSPQTELAETTGLPTYSLPASSLPASEPSTPPDTAEVATESSDPDDQQPVGRQRTEDLFLPEGEQRRGPPQPPPWRPPIEDERAKAAGIRRLDGKHIVVYTDLPAKAAVDELPRAFDLAVPQWCRYFGVDVDSAKDWKVTGYVMDNRQRFRATGLLPDDLPPFLHGFQRSFELWVYEQPSDYYRRHLLLHEGVHAFMRWRLGGAGPPWYMEGMAEFLGTHRWQGGKLQVGYVPRSREESDHWGRVRIIKDDVDESGPLNLAHVIQYGPQAHLQVEPYAWSWAACLFLDQHPTYQAAFRSTQKRLQEGDRSFNRYFLKGIEKHAARLDAEWQVFASEVEYGHDVARCAIEVVESKPFSTKASTRISAVRGWQSAGLRLPPGRYSVRASGRFQIADDGRPWMSEADGVTIRYYRGRPLGQLLAAVANLDEPARTPTRLLTPVAIGGNGEIAVKTTGDLYLRINDSPGELRDNKGEVTVTVDRAAAR
ncbi:MAG: hypothetical protein QF805_09080 [Pirellulaceae bacterium]|nr:hypothetical protein [Pirellulaceae bacterium]